MAQASAFKTYDAIGNREDLSDVISIVARDEAPLYSSLKKVKATSTVHSWLTDSLSTGSDNAAIEGADFAFAIPATRSLQTNYCQIFTKTVEVSETQRAVDPAGVDDEFSYQLEKRMKEIATDIEKALITGTGNSGASGTARRMSGALALITTNVETGTGTATEYLTEDMYNDALQTIWAAGGRPDYTYVNGFQKRQISAFSSNNQRYQQVDSEGELKNSVGVYESDFGVQRIELDPFMSTDVALLVQKDMLAVASLRGISMTDVAKVGDAKRGALVGELTLEVKNELACGKITELKTS